MNKTILYCSFFSICSFSLMQAYENVPVTDAWFTGPLIAPPGTVVQGGHYEIEYYFFWNATTGVYDKKWHARSKDNLYSFNPQIFTLIGLTEWMDFQVTPQFFYNYAKGSSAIRFGDLTAGFDFQLVGANLGKWIPGVKLGIIETFPTGQYQKFNPHKNGVELSGMGSFATDFNLVFYKVFPIKDFHFLSATLSFAYTLFVPTHVRGFNAYGGGYHTRGKIFPGTELLTILSFEYSFNRNWAFAIDNVYKHGDKDRFKGRKGRTSRGSSAIVGRPSSEQISFAPAIEYNFSANFGIIAGSWFSAWGRNSPVFRSAVVEVVCTY